MYEKIFLLLICHLIGDYVLQSNFLAETKGENWYHLFVHSVLYTVPFYICFGFNGGLIYLAVTHFIIDTLKARFNCLSYVGDQIGHYLIVACYFLGWIF